MVRTGFAFLPLTSAVSSRLQLCLTFHVVTEPSRLQCIWPAAIRYALIAAPVPRGCDAFGRLLLLCIIAVSMSCSCDGVRSAGLAIWLPACHRGCNCASQAKKACSASIQSARHGRWRNESSWITDLIRRITNHAGTRTDLSRSLELKPDADCGRGWLFPRFRLTSRSAASGGSRSPFCTGTLRSVIAIFGLWR